MITKINIKNFKSLKDVTIECSHLNVLTGLNGMGKSSIIQSLLLLKQSYENGFLTASDGGIILNGELVENGTAKEILYEFAKKDEINFEYDFNVDGLLINKSWFFTYEISQPDKLEESKFSGADFMPYSESSRPDSLEILSLFKRNNFKYLHADRWVKNEYGISDLQVGRYRSLGKHGEYTSHYLDFYGSSIIHKDLLFPGSKNNDLKTQVSAWMSKISPGTKVITERSPGSNSVRLRYEFIGEEYGSKIMTPLNVGFGITYVLPVLVALLSSKPGDLLIIENPESHIHPKGQSLIANLMAKVANTGVQLFIETHSDHIINGIRVAVKNGVSEKLIKIYFLARGENKNFLSTQLDLINLDKDGRIEYWPKDFFDEWDNNLLELL